MKATEQYLLDGKYPGFKIKNGKLNQFVGKSIIEVWDNECRCVQQLGRKLFNTKQSIIEESILDDNYRLVAVDYVNKTITDLTY